MRGVISTEVILIGLSNSFLLIPSLRIPLFTFGHEENSADTGPTFTFQDTNESTETRQDYRR